MNHDLFNGAIWLIVGLGLLLAATGYLLEVDAIRQEMPRQDYSRHLRESHETIPH